MRTSSLLDRYKCFVDESYITGIYEIARSLAGLRVLHVNTTAQGGGVAEILHELIPLMEELGIKHDWKVIPLDDASGYFTACLVDMLQGYEAGELPEKEKQVFLEKLRRSMRDGKDFLVGPFHSSFPKGVADAIAPDETIEAVSMPNAKGFLLGLQWHPEWRWSENPISREIFAAFANAVHEYTSGR